MAIHQSGLALLTLMALAFRCWLSGGVPVESRELADSKRESSAASSVDRILANWDAAEGSFQGRPCRGFSGTVQFLDASGHAIAADGEVMIYVFDDQGTPEERAKPLCLHRYPAESWNALRLSEPEPKYGVFVPYTRNGDHKAECRLRVRFRPTNGRDYVWSDGAAVTLPEDGESGTKRSQDDRRQ